MKDNEFELYKCISNMTQEALRKSLVNVLKKHYTNVITTKEYVMAQGETPIALVAHLDTVFPYGKRKIYYDREAQVIWSPNGLGADDRAGVFAILLIIQHGFRPTVIFTTDEELGCLGVDKLVLDYPEPPWPINYIIQLDRQGANDCVFYNCNNPEFEKYIEEFGFVSDFGSFSDISAICPAWGIAGVNLSVGYINEHTLQETLHVKFWKRTIKQVEKMLKKEKIPTFDYIPRYPHEHKFFDYLTCSCCGEMIDPYLTIPVDDEVFCPTCSVDKIDWCKKCGAPYVLEKKEKHVCKEENDDRGDQTDSGTV